MRYEENYVKDVYFNRKSEDDNKVSEEFIKYFEKHIKTKDGDYSKYNFVKWADIIYNIRYHLLSNCGSDCHSNMDSWNIPIRNFIIALVQYIEKNVDIYDYIEEKDWLIKNFSRVMYDMSQQYELDTRYWHCVKFGVKEIEKLKKKRFHNHNPWLDISLYIPFILLIVMTVIIVWVIVG